LTFRSHNTVHDHTSHVNESDAFPAENFNKEATVITEVHGSARTQMKSGFDVGGYWGFLG
jgi:hypothetical protein